MNGFLVQYLKSNLCNQYLPLPKSFTKDFIAVGFFNGTGQTWQGLLKRGLKEVYFYTSAGNIDVSILTVGT